MTHPGGSDSEPPPPSCESYSVLRRLLDQDNNIPYGPHNPSSSTNPNSFQDDTYSVGRTPSLPDTDLPLRIPPRRVQREVVPGLPRSQTLKRQFSERRDHLTPVETSLEERRAASAENRSAFITSAQQSDIDGPQSYLPTFATSYDEYNDMPLSASPVSAGFRDLHSASFNDRLDAQSFPTPSLDPRSMTASEYDAMIVDELEKVWILNLSMQFRDQSRREKFFVTYRIRPHLWQRVTISLDYRNAPPNSLEAEMADTKYQREKSAKIYEAIRESLHDIKFFPTVTNLKLQTLEGRLNVHVVEDGNEIINFPSVDLVKHLGCRRIMEDEIVFDSHMSGFVYKVIVDGQPLIKKEIPSPDTIEEFLYEVNALNSLEFSPNIIKFQGVVVDENDEIVKGLLISYAEQGALMDIIYDNCKESHLGIPWKAREKWAQQIVRGLADVHESGFVQGDFTLSNVVIDDAGDAKIIDINRRGCPVRWEPPEATALLESGQRLSLYIGVKSDLYQLGMVLWALAMEEDEPENQGRPLVLGPEINIPDWYRQITEICLSSDPRCRLAASQLVHMMPPLPVLEPIDPVNSTRLASDPEAAFYNQEHRHEAAYSQLAHGPVHERPQQHQRPLTYDPFYTTRGRSPPSPMPSNSSRDRLNKSKGADSRSLPRAANGIQSLSTQTLPHRQFIPTPDHDSPLGRRCDSPQAMRPVRMRTEDSTATAVQTLTPNGDDGYEKVPSNVFDLDRHSAPETSDFQETNPELAALNQAMAYQNNIRRTASPPTRHGRDMMQHAVGLENRIDEWRESRRSVGSGPAATESVIPDWMSEIVSRTSTPDIDVEGGANLSSDAEEAALERDLAYGSGSGLGFLPESHSNQTVLGPGQSAGAVGGMGCSKEEMARLYIEGRKATSAAHVGLDGGMDDEFTKMTGPRLPAF